MYTQEQYKILASRFNSNSFLGKLLLIKQHKNLFEIETDGHSVRLRLLDDNAMQRGDDLLFSFPEFFEYSHLKDIFSLGNIKIKEL